MIQKAFRPFPCAFYPTLIYCIVLFLLVGIDIEGDVIQYSNLKMIEGLSFGEFLKHLLRAFSLSTSLFSGVGDELCEPTIQSVILADIEMIFGVIVMGLGIGTLTRKIVR